MDKHSKFDVRVFGEFLAREPKNWDQVISLAGEIERAFRGSDIFGQGIKSALKTRSSAKDNEEIHRSNTSYLIGLGARAAQHDGMAVHRVEIDDLRMARDYGLAIVYFQAYLAQEHGINKGNARFKSISDSPSSGGNLSNFSRLTSFMITQTRAPFADAFEKLLENHRKEERGIPSAGAIEAVIRDQFYKSREPLPDDMYKLIALSLASPDSPGGAGQVFNPRKTL